MSKNKSLILLFSILIINFNSILKPLETIERGNFQFLIFKDKDPIASALADDILGIDSEIKKYFNFEYLIDSPIYIELVDAKNDETVVKRDYVDLPRWIAAYAVPTENKVVMRYNSIGSYPYIELRAVLKHELVHIYLDKIVRDKRNQIPKWFQEGLAMYIGRKWGFDDYYQLTIGMMRINYIPLRELENFFPQSEYEVRIAYAESFSFLNYLVKRYGEESLKEILSRLAKGERFYEVLKSLTKQSISDLEKDWISESLKYYRWIPFIASTSFLWIIITLFSIYVYWNKHRKKKLLYKKWEEEDML